MNLIRSFTAIFLSAVIAFSLTVPFTSAAEVLPGDVDGDGSVTVMDATVIQRVLAHLQEPDGRYAAAGDADSDGDVTIADATLIQRYEAKMIPALPFVPHAPTEAPAASPTDPDGWGTVIIRP